MSWDRSSAGDGRTSPSDMNLPQKPPRKTITGPPDLMMKSVGLNAPHKQKF